MTALSLIIPCFNEAHRLHITFQGVLALCRALPFPVQLVLADDGSTDDTSAHAQNMATAALTRGLSDFCLLSLPHQGRGGALRAGALAGEGDYLFVADADWSMPPELVLAFLPPVLSAFDLAIGTREGLGARRFEEPLLRHLMGRGFNRWVQALVLPEIDDTQCGYKCFRREVGRVLFGESRLNGWALDVELLVRARAYGLRLVEVPVDWRYQPDSRRVTHRDGPRMALDVLRLRWWLVNGEIPTAAPIPWASWTVGPGAEAAPPEG